MGVEEATMNKLLLAALCAISLVVAHSQALAHDRCYDGDHPAFDSRNDDQWRFERERRERYERETRERYEREHRQRCEDRYEDEHRYSHHDFRGFIERAFR